MDNIGVINHLQTALFLLTAIFLVVLETEPRDLHRTLSLVQCSFVCLFVSLSHWLAQSWLKLASASAPTACSCLSLPEHSEVCSYLLHFLLEMEKEMTNDLSAICSILIHQHHCGKWFSGISILFFIKLDTSNAISKHLL